MNLGIEGKVALVMGASRGIGRGAACALAREGARVAIASRSQERIEACVPARRERGFGRIVNITSVSTREPIPGLILSNSHRLAAVGTFKTLSRELARDGILLNSVAPGLIATDRIAELQGKPLEE